MSEQSGQVDLSVCQVGDECHTRRGSEWEFQKAIAKGPHWVGEECRYVVSGVYFHRDGRLGNGRNNDPDDIVRVTRNGEQITPAPVVVMKEQGAERRICKCGNTLPHHTCAQPAATGEVEEIERLTQNNNRLEMQVETYKRASAYWWRNYCEAVGREPHATVNADAEFIREFDAMRDAMWVCMEHNRLYFGKDHNTVTQAAAALDGWKPSAPPSPAETAGEKPEQPVITGPGKYLSEMNDARVCEVVGKGLGLLWYGMGVNGPDAWDASGESYRWPHDGGNLTGPYVEPPEPVLTITPMRQEYGWVYAWCEYKGDLRPGEGKGPIHVLLYDDHPGYVPVDGHLAFVSGGPFVCREKHWPRVQELVAQVNAGKAVGT